MKKRLFSTLFIVSLISLILGSIISIFNEYSNIKKTEETAIISITQMTRNIFQNSESDIESLKLLTIPNEYRLTVFDKNKKPLYDSTKEIEDFSQGEKSIGIENLHNPSVVRDLGYEDDVLYASILASNGTIIRVTKEITRLNDLFLNILPNLFFAFLILIIFISWITNNFVNKTIEPLYGDHGSIEELDLTNIPELTAFISEVKRKKNLQDKKYNELLLERKTMKTILENMRQGMIILDENKDIISVSQEALDLLNWDKEVNDLNIIYLIRNEEFLDDISKSLKDGEISGLLEIDDKLVRYYLTPVEMDYSKMGIIILFIDETQRIQNETIRREFSSNVSHELKTPLTSISGFAELLNNDLIKEEDKEDIYQSIYNEAQRLLALIEDIMIISKLEEGESVEYQEIDVRSVIEDILFSYKEEINRQNISIDLKGKGEIYSNNNLVWKAYSNIIENAIKYNKYCGSINIEIIEEQNNLCLSVADTGIGISEKDMDRIFERFFRAEKSRNKELGGTGLGLSIVKHSVNSLNGSVEIDSELDKGTRFIIRLPKSPSKKAD